MNMLTIDPLAIAKIKEIIAEENDTTIKLRVFVEGGGCSGFQYGFKLDTDQAEDDYVIDADGLFILVDSVSAQYLTGATVSYIEDLSGSMFKISNPNAQSTCRCGSSFSTAG